MSAFKAQRTIKGASRQKDWPYMVEFSLKAICEVEIFYISSHRL